MTKTRRWAVLVGFIVLSALALGLVIWYVNGRGAQPAAPDVSGPASVAVSGPQAQEYTLSGYAMSTLINQSGYGPNAMDAMREVNRMLVAYEERLSLFSETGDIARVNAAAGKGGAEVAPETADLLRQALALSAQSEDTFAITIAPVTLAWGVTGDTPRVVGQDELDELLPLVDDAAVVVEGNHVELPKEGMALDLGGIAKGAACSLVAEIYEEYGVESAYLYIGGNIYVRGTKPGGAPFRIGFRDPWNGGYMASFPMTDRVIAVSGGQERNFEVDGETYIHIFDPRTGRPAESDIAAVGVICEDGAEADFYSTTLYVMGRDRALEQMRGGLCAILLDNDGTLYVSESLREGFMLHDEENYRLEFVPGA